MMDWWLQGNLEVKVLVKMDFGNVCKGEFERWWSIWEVRELL